MVQCFDAQPMILEAVGRSLHANDGNRVMPFVHFDDHIAAGWSSVYISSEASIIAKFAYRPKVKKSKLIRLLEKEVRAYEKLGRLQWWAVPKCFGL